MNAQQMIAANVAARGYVNGWTQEQLIARQLAKLAEELGEASYSIDFGVLYLKHGWLMDLLWTAEGAKQAFDDPQRWHDITIVDLDNVRSELADMLVVLMTAAEALEFDILQAAIDKSATDVTRGIRNGV